MNRAAIFGCAGTRLDADEKAFFREADPWGFIVFARNLSTHDQIRRLCDDLRNAVGRDAPILIDQEGGRVARLMPPDWTEWQDALPYLLAMPQELRADAMRLRAGVIASELIALGIDVNCAPLGDIAQDDTHPFLKNRCYGHEAEAVTEIARAVANGLISGGVLPVLKHMPGHGRARVDSHHDLPCTDAPLEVLETTDFAPFRALADLPLGMSAHVVFEALDPEMPATLSTVVIAHLRQSIGFNGLLMTDDLSMEALPGTVSHRAAAAIRAGCDVILHCNGTRAEMERVAEQAPSLSGPAAKRADAALAQRPGNPGVDPREALATLADLTEVHNA